MWRIWVGALIWTVLPLVVAIDSVEEMQPKHVELVRSVGVERTMGGFPPDEPVVFLVPPRALPCQRGSA